MAVEDDQTNWRTVFCSDPDVLQVTSYPSPGAEHTVVQSDPTKLRCTTTPNVDVPQVVVQKTGVKGIWPAANSVRVHGQGLQSGSGSTDIYTVPANKKLYVNAAQVTIQSTAGGSFNGRMSAKNGSDVFQFHIIYFYIRIEGSLSEAAHYSPAIELEAGWDLYMFTTHASVAVRGLFFGWLEDA